MKQHITAKQLNEFIELELDDNYCKILNLNEKRYDKLCKLIGKKSVMPENMLIGKMIEILSIYKLDKIYTPYNRNLCYVSLRVTPCIDCEALYYVKELEAKELCDALWEAVKYVLGKELEDEE